MDSNACFLDQALECWTHILLARMQKHDLYPATGELGKGNYSVCVQEQENKMPFTVSVTVED